MPWIMFVLGSMFGGTLGVFVMCLCIVSGEATRREEEMER